MKDPEIYDDDGFFDSLSKGDTTRFKKLYRSKWGDISGDRAQSSLKSRYRDLYQPRHKIFKAVKDGFSPKDTFGSNNGFESSIVNPLYHSLSEPADLLIAKKTYRDVHLAFVFCEVGDEDRYGWVQRVNETYDAFQEEENKNLLKEQLECLDLELGTVQYLTIARESDLFELDFDTLRAAAQPDSYAILAHVEEREERKIVPEKGNIEHKKLVEVFEPFLDYSKFDFTNIKYRLDSHPIRQLQETLLSTMVAGLSDKNNEHPKEFDRADFLTHFDSGLGVGPVCEPRREAIQNKAEVLLQIAVDTEMVFQDSDEINTDRSYRFRTQGSIPEDVKATVKNKYFKNRSEHERGRLAYQRANIEFEPQDSELDEYF